MAENIPPGSASAVKTSTSNDRPGLPYYEKLRRDLRDTIQKKRLLDRNMAAIEDQIYRQETAYLEETSAGNIVKGFDNYIKASAVTSSASAGGGTISGSAAGGGPGARRKVPASEADRVFSKSSVSYSRDSDTSSSAVSTPAHAGTPLGSFTEKGEKKKKKAAAAAAAADDETEGRTTKRQKITFGPGRKKDED